MRKVPTLAALAATDLVIGFGIQVVVLLSVGVGAKTDAYYAGQAPLIVLLAIFQLPLQRAVVGAYAESSASRYPAGSLIGASVLAMGSLVGLLVLAGPWLFHLLYPELDAAAQATALSVLRVQGVATALTTGNMVMLSLNQVGGRFTECEIALVAASLISAAVVLLAVGRHGVMAAAYAQVVKACICALLYFLLLLRRLGWARPPWAQIWSVVKPLASAGALSKLTPIVDRSIASGALSGSLTVLVFAQTMYGAVATIGERAIVAPRLPELKRTGQQAGLVGLAKVLALVGIASVVLAASAVALVRATGVASEFVSDDVLSLLLVSLLFLAGFPIATMSAQWLAAAIIFAGKPRLTARVMTWCFVFGVVVKIIGFRVAGIPGLALAMSSYYIASAVSLWLVLRALASARDRAGGQERR